MSERPRIVLGEEDFAAEAPPAPAPLAPTAPPGQVPGAAPAAPAPTLPVAAPVSAPKPPGAAPGALPAVSRGMPLRVDAPYAPSVQKPGSNALRVALMGREGRSLLIAAAVGIFAGWMIGEVTGLAEFSATTRGGLEVKTGLWTGVVGVVFGGVLLGYERAVGGAWEAAASRFVKAALPMFAAGFVAGYFAEWVYSQIIKGVLEEALRGEGGGLGKNDVRFYLARALGWAVFGVGIGAMVGLLNRSRKQAINGAIGGVIGGTVGGLVFQFMASNVQASSGVLRLLGLAAIGALIAIATRVVETARREAWLEVVAGGMAGKEFILYHPVTRLGSAPDSEIFLLKDSGIAPLHATIEDRGTERALSPAGAQVFVNGEPVTATRVLRSGDQLQLGSTLISYSERAIAPVGAA
ncbi:MAG: FHA domain-containing protein [Solirubrobacteraceae bacterium]